MTDIATFLLARIDEQEAKASDVHQLGCGATLSLPMDCDCGQPDLIEAECAAERLVVHRWLGLQRRIDSEEDARRRGVLALTRQGLDMFIYQFAALYADHPDYSPTWKP